MARDEIVVDGRELIHRFRISVRMPRLFGARVWIATRLFSVAGYVSGTNVVVESEAPGDALREGIAEALQNEDGVWRTCSGCYELCDGQPVGKYPFSDMFGCTLGSGCGECGGIGAVWDTTDYADMGDFLAYSTQ